MRVAVVPARGGSKRVPRKNIKLFHGRPMIAYAITAAQRSKLFDRVIVSTDDEEIAQIAKKHGAEVPFLRPAELSDDQTPTVPVIAHSIKSLKEMNWSVTEACCIYPGVPFISANDLWMAYEKLKNSDAHYVFPITNFPSPIQRALRLLSDGAVEPFYPEFVSTRTQDLEAGFYDVGQFYWGKAQAWLDGMNIHQNAKTIVIPEWRVVDIDTLADWDRAELLYSTLRDKGLI